MMTPGFYPWRVCLVILLDSVAVLLEGGQNKVVPRIYAEYSPSITVKYTPWGLFVQPWNFFSEYPTRVDLIAADAGAGAGVAAGAVFSGRGG